MTKYYHSFPPTGYVPNSVIRSVIKVHPPKEEKKEESQWKLKPVPGLDLTRIFSKVTVSDDDDVGFCLSEVCISNNTLHVNCIGLSCCTDHPP